MLFAPRPPDVSARVIAILGMHRSGTSCMAGSLQAKGLFLGEVPEWNEHNRKGNRENEAIANLNESVLAWNGGSWHQPPDRVRWNRTHAKQRNRIVAEFEATDRPLWGFKDPRVTLLADFWRDAVPAIEFVGTFRNPLLVAQSLNKRDTMPVAYALNAWTAYNERMLQMYRRKPFPIISFDLGPDAYIAAIDRLALTMRLPEPAGAAFMDDQLQTSDAALPEDLPDARARELFAELNAAYQETLGA